jgi:hypothetical protein
LGLLDPDPLVTGTDPNPPIIKQRIVRKTLISNGDLGLFIFEELFKCNLKVTSKKTLKK